MKPVRGSPASSSTCPVHLLPVSSGAGDDVGRQVKTWTQTRVHGVSHPAAGPAAHAGCCITVVYL